MDEDFLLGLRRLSSCLLIFNARFKFLADSNVQSNPDIVYILTCEWKIANISADGSMRLNRGAFQFWGNPFPKALAE